MDEHDLTEVQLRARALVTGWVLALWALGFGLYLTLGGAQGLTSPAYSILMSVIHEHNEWVGQSLLVAGMLNVVAMATRRNLLIAVAALLCGLWCAAISFYMGWSALTVTGAGNANMFTSALAAFFFFMRFLSYRRCPAE